MSKRKPYNSDPGYKRGRKLSRPFGTDTHLVLYDRQAMADDPGGVQPVAERTPRWALVLRPSGRWISLATLDLAEAFLDRIYRGAQDIKALGWQQDPNRWQSTTDPVADALTPAIGYPPESATLDPDDIPRPLTLDDLPFPGDTEPFAQAAVAITDVDRFIVTQKRPGGSVWLQVVRQLPGSRSSMGLGSFRIPADQARAVADAILAVAQASEGKVD